MKHLIALLLGSQSKTSATTVRGIRQTGPRPLALEQRFMFDGAAVATAEAVHESQPLDAAVASHTIDAGVALDAPATIAAPVAERQEIVFIDTSVPDWQTLAAAVKTGTETVLLDPHSDELAQIAAALQGRTGIDAIHIIGHGAEGDLILGELHLTEQNINEHSSELTAIQHALSADGDLLLYGCDVGAGADGLQLLGSLADLTGADVAASSNDTGGSGGDWALEQQTGTIEAGLFGSTTDLAAFENRLSSFNLAGSTGWVPIMFGPMQDPQGDSQAGAADTDIVGDATHGSLYTYYDDKGTASTADDTLAFRLRIDNPTSTTNFGGVAIVGMDANGDGRIDLFFTVDGRNNTQAVRLLDPGTGLNISPNTTTTSPLPTGWLPNNGVYPFGGSNYSVVAVSSATDSNWNGDADLGNAGGTDVFVSWQISMNDIATVLAKPSATDRNGVYGPRGATGIAGFNKDTSVQYVSFTQTQPGPINGDLNGVGSSYDKNATFAALGAFTAPMTASTPIAAGPVIKITSTFGDGVLNDSEDNSVTVTGTTTSITDGTQLSLTVSDGSNTLTFLNATTVNNGAWTTNGLDLSTLDNGTLTFTATVDPDSNAGTANSISDSRSVLHDKTAPTIGIDQLANAISGKPTFTGTSNLSDGSLVTVTIDPDNNSGTVNSLIYQVAVSGGLWSLNTATMTPMSGSLSSSGLTSIAKVSATATDAAGNSATATAQNHPTVNTLSTNDTTPTITGTWTNISGDALTVSVNGVTYTAGDGNLAVTGNSWSLTIPGGNALSSGTYSVTATVTRGGNPIIDTTGSEITITSTPTPVVDITGGTSASGNDTTPVISGTSNNAGGYVIVRLDPNNDGDLADAVTYSVTPDGSGNWTLDTGSATPISGSVPSGGFIGAVGIRVTDSTGAAVDTQTLTVGTPTVAIGTIASTATTNSAAQVNNGGAAANYLNKTEDDTVTISGTANGASTVDVTITDVNGHVVTANGVAVNSGSWSASGLNLSGLDDGVLTVKATITDTAVSATNTSVTHDKTAPVIDITAQDPLKKTAAVITGKTDLANGTLLTVQVYDGATLKAEWNSISVASGAFTTSGISPNSGSANIGNGGPFTINVFPTSTTTDSAGNIAQMVTETRTGQPNSSTNSIAIGAVAGGDGINTPTEISNGVTISGTTTLTGTPTINIAVIDGSGNTVNLSTTASSGAWSTTLTNANIKTLANGALTITANATDTVSSVAYTISDTAFSSLTVPSPILTITDDTPATATGAVTYTFTFSEAVTGFTASDITVVNGTKGSLSGSGTTYTMVITPTASSTGTMAVSVADSMAISTATGRGNIGATDDQAFVTTGAAAAPTLTINTDNLASDSTPVISGTTSLSAGAPIVIEIDTNNDGVTDLTYAATVQSVGNWSIDIGSATPTTGTLASEGLPTGAKITARATNAYGNSTTATGLNTPVVITQTTNDNTPTISGTWTQIGGDTLSVVVNGVTYSAGNGNLTVGATSWSLTPTLALADNTYNVTASVARSATTKTDLTNSELIVDTIGSVDIAGGASVTTNDSTPVIAGTTAGLPDGTVLTLEIDSDNSGSYDLVYRTVVNSNSWSIDTASAIPYSGSFPAAGLNGSVPMRAIASDAAGNSGLDTQTLNVDITPPGIGITSSSRTPDTTPLISGTTDLPNGTSITVDVDPNNDGDWSDQQTYITTVQSDGTWSITASTPLSGTVGVRASGTDAAGNTTTTTQTLVIDLSAPTLAIDKPNSSVGIDNSADASEDDSIIFTGSTTSIAAGNTISVLVSDGTITISDTATVDGSGNWSLLPLNLSSMANGTIHVSATFIDNAGNAFTDTFNFAHNKTTTVAIDSISQDTGALADFITKDNTIAISGSATANAAVAIVVKDSGNNTVASFNVSANNSGQWSTAATSTLASGDYTIQATVGVTTVTHALTIVDATAPLLSSSTPLDNASNIGINNNLSLTFNKTVQFGSGTIDLYRADNTLIESFNVNTLSGNDGGALSVNNAKITLDPGSSLTPGTGYYIKIDSTAITDTVGNSYAGISNATTLNFTTSASADVTPPATPSIDLLASSDTGVSNSDDHTSDNTPTLRVTLNGSGATAPVAGDVAKLYADGVLVGTATLSSQNISDGYVDITSGSLSDGTISFAAIVTDAANNDSNASNALPVVIDTGAPIPTMAINSVTSDGVINSSEAAGSVAITGTVGGDAIDGDTVTLTINGNTYTGTVSSSAFSINVAGSDLVADSDHTIDASISTTDSAGNTGNGTATRSFSIDTSAPTLSSSTPADNATNVGVNNNITLTFNETVQVGSGTIGLYLSDNTLIESFDVSTMNGDNGGTLSHVGTTITLNPGASLTSATGYYIHIDNTAVTDTAGNNYVGISNATTLNFTTSTSADVTPPAAPSIDLLANSDTGVSSIDDYTSDNTPTLRVALNGSGATAPIVGDVAKLYADGVLVGSATLTSQNITDGYVDITSSTLSDSPISFDAIITDAANNDSNTSNALPVVIDTGVPIPTLVINTVTSDSVINSSEASGSIAISGTVGGDAVDGDTVTLTINGNTYSGTVSSGVYSINVASSDLVADIDHIVDAWISTTDSAGNTGSGTATRSYSVDTAAPNLTIAINSVTSDGVVNASEASGNVAVTGIVGGDAVDGDTVTLTINGNTYTGTVSSGVFSISVAGSNLVSDNDHVIDAYISKTDSAGNTGSATTTRSYSADTAAPNITIAVDSVTSDGVINANEAAGNVAISGSVGGDATNGDTITLTINGTTYTGTVSGGAFSINVAGSDLVADSDHVIDASISKTDVAGNIATANATRGVVIDIAPSIASLAINTIAPVDSNATGVIAITGSVGGDARDGDIVTLVVNGKNYLGTVSGGVFSINVDANDLLADSDRSIAASMTTLDNAGNSGVTDASLVYSIAPTATPVVPLPETPKIPPPVDVPSIVTTPPISEPAISATVTTTISSVAQPIVFTLPSAIPISGGGAQSLLDDSGLRRTEFSIEPTQAASTSYERANVSDILTAPGEKAFRVAVIKSNVETLMLFKGINDQEADVSASSPFVHFVMPADAFAHTNPKAVIYLTARLANGQKLPAWLSFNPTTGTFEGEPPLDESGEIQIIVIARDDAGREASATFRIHIHEVAKKVTNASRPSLSELIRIRQTSSAARRYS